LANSAKDLLAVRGGGVLFLLSWLKPSWEGTLYVLLGALQTRSVTVTSNLGLESVLSGFEGYIRPTHLSLPALRTLQRPSLIREYINQHPPRRTH
jgi:hypothetical protein